MSINIKIEDGETFIKGRSREVAQELLERAEALGVDLSLVRTTSHGYIVPTAILDAEDADDTEDANTAEKESEEFDPSVNTVDAIKEYLSGEDVTDEERNRVLEAEANGKNRAALKAGTKTEGAK